MDAKKISRIRRAVKKAKKSSGHRVRYPKQIKAEVAEILQAGVRPTKLSELTGLAVATIFKWSRVSTEDAGPKAFRRMTVRSEARSMSRPMEFTVRLPNGIAIDCRSVDALKECLGAVR